MTWEESDAAAPSPDPNVPASPWRRRERGGRDRGQDQSGARRDDAHPVPRDGEPHVERRAGGIEPGGARAGGARAGGARASDVRAEALRADGRRAGPRRADFEAQAQTPRATGRVPRTWRWAARAAPRTGVSSTGRRWGARFPFCFSSTSSLLLADACRATAKVCPGREISRRSGFRSRNPVNPRIPPTLLGFIWFMHKRLAAGSCRIRAVGVAPAGRRAAPRRSWRRLAYGSVGSLQLEADGGQRAVGLGLRGSTPAGRGAPYVASGPCPVRPGRRSSCGRAVASTRAHWSPAPARC